MRIRYFTDLDTGQGHENANVFENNSKKCMQIHVKRIQRVA